MRQMTLTEKLIDKLNNTTDKEEIKYRHNTKKERVGGIIEIIGYLGMVLNIPCSFILCYLASFLPSHSLYYVLICFLILFIFTILAFVGAKLKNDSDEYV